MNAIDPNLPAQLRWAANKVDAIVANPFWKGKIWTDSNFGDSQFGSVSYWSDTWVSNLWVGRAAEAHADQMGVAKEQVEAAHRLLVQLRDELERQAQAAANQIEAQKLLTQLTNLLRQF
jgi:Zn-dependent protease with chaperone function